MVCGACSGKRDSLYVPCIASSPSINYKLLQYSIVAIVINNRIELELLYIPFQTLLLTCISQDLAGSNQETILEPLVTLPIIHITIVTV